MNVNDSTSAFPYDNAGYRPYLIDGAIVWMHDQLFSQTRTIQFPFQKIVRLRENHVWVELV